MAAGPVIVVVPATEEPVGAAAGHQNPLAVLLRGLAIHRDSIRHQMVVQVLLDRHKPTYPAVAAEPILEVAAAADHTTMLQMLAVLAAAVL